MSTAQAKRRILVVEDDHDIATAIADRLDRSGYHVDVAFDGPTGLAQARATKPDLVVLDLMLPGISGHEVCRTIQAEQQTPILMLTALADETDVLVGLRTGADDYMTKPFSPRELVARIEAILRRTESTIDAATELPTTVTLGSIAIDQATRRVTVEHLEVHLTPTEFNLAIALVEANGAVLSRSELLHQAWGYNDDVGTRTVDSHIRSLRRKLGDDVIRTVHGIGYAIGPSA